MGKHNQIHTLGALHYKAQFDFWENYRILSAPYGLKNTVNACWWTKVWELFTPTKWASGKVSDQQSRTFNWIKLWESTVLWPCASFINCFKNCFVNYLHHICKCPRRKWQGKFCWFWSIEKWLRSWPRTRWCFWPGLVPSWCEASRTRAVAPTTISNGKEVVKRKWIQ